MTEVFVAPSVQQTFSTMRIPTLTLHLAAIPPTAWRGQCRYTQVQHYQHYVDFPPLVCIVQLETSLFSPELCACVVIKFKHTILEVGVEWKNI